MTFFVCGCGFSAKSWIEPDKHVFCKVCLGELLECEQLPLSFYNRRKSFLEISEDDLFQQEKLVLEAIKILKMASDRDIAEYLGIERSSVNGRRNRLMNASIPFIKEVGSKVDEKTKKTVTLWGVV